jgi:hypothetical protein
MYNYIFCVLFDTGGFLPPGPCQVVYGWGSEIKNLGPIPFGAPPQKLFQKPKHFSAKYWRRGKGRRSQKIFQTLNLHNEGLNLVLKIFLDQFSRKFLNI